jgi:hypothetical protein
MSNDSAFSSYDDEAPKKGSLFKALAVCIPATILLGLIIGLTEIISPETNLVHRYSIYMAGILIIFVAAILTRSVLKMVFVATPLIVITSFIGPFLLPDFFDNIFGLFIHSLPGINSLIDISLDHEIVSLDQETTELLTLFLQFFFVIDLILALIVGFIAAIGLTLMVKVFSKKPDALAILGIVFGLIFMLFGAIIFPYAFIGISGTTQFSVSMANGGAYLALGMDKVGEDFSGSAADEATEYFLKANQWFKDAQDILQGLEDLGLFWLVGQTLPEFKVIVDNGQIIITAGTELVQGLGPFIVGMVYLSNGFAKASSGFTNEPMALVLSQSDAEFEAGLADLEAGFQNLTQAITHIKASVDTLNEMDESEFKQALIDLTGDPEAAAFVNILIGGSELIDLSLDVLEVFINPINETTQAPMIHLLKGMRSLNEAGDTIGTSSNYAGTKGAFSDVAGNLSIVNEVFDHQALTNFYAYDETQLDGNLIGIYDQMLGAFRFLDDSTRVGVNLGHFGNGINPVLSRISESLEIFKENNVTEIPDEVYDEKIALMELNAIESIALLETSEELLSDIELMDSRPDGYYGAFDANAKEFVNMFQEFELDKNANNFIYLSYAMENVFRVGKSVKEVNIYIDNIRNDLDAVFEEETVLDQLTELFNRSDDIKGNVTTADELLVKTIANLDLAVGNMSALEDMDQLDSVQVQLSLVMVDLEKMRGSEAGAGEDVLADATGLTQIILTIEFVEDNFADPSPYSGEDLLGFVQSGLDDVLDALDSVSANMAGIQVDD